MSAARAQALGQLRKGEITPWQAHRELERAAAGRAERRRHLGAEPTPMNLSRELASWLTLKADTTVLEPACGRGALLVALLERQSALLGSAREAAAWARRGLRGIEIDPKSAEDAIELLDAWLRSQGVSARQADLSACLAVGDALFPVKKGAARPFEREFDRFDAAFLNPPYVRFQTLPEATRAALRQTRASCARGNVDLSFAFVEDALDRAGEVCALFPNSWLDSAAGAGLRELALPRLARLADLTSAPVFAAATAYVNGALWRANSSKSFQWLRGDPSVAANDANWMKVDKASAIAEPAAPWRLGKLLLAQASEAVGVDRQAAANEPQIPLRELCEIRGGLCTQADAVYFFDSDLAARDAANDDRAHIAASFKGEASARTVEAAASVPVVNWSRTKTRAALLASTRRALYPYAEDGAGMGPATWSKAFPMADAWLRERQSALLARDSHEAPEDWRLFGRAQGCRPLPRDAWLLGVPGIVNGPMSPVVFRASDVGGRLAWVNGFVLVCKSKAGAQRLAKALASEATWRQVDALGSARRGGWRALGARLLASLTVALDASPRKEAA